MADVIYAGTKFTRSEPTPGHIVLTPTDDPNWLLRWIHEHRLPGFEVKPPAVAETRRTDGGG